MKEYIERQELIDSINRDDDPNFGKWDALFHAKSADAADVVEVVRCKDCIYCTGFDQRGIFRLCKFLEECPVVVRHDDFCSNGVRKED